MNRRKYLQLTASALPVSMMPPTFLSSDTLASMPTRTLPKPLFKGATVGIVSPSSAISRTQFEHTLANLQRLGLKTQFSQNIRVKKGFLAGTDAQRLADLHQMFEDKSVDAIICARGGYGSQRLLPKVDYELIKKHPKIFIGYSDITALHIAIFQKTGLVCFHGPNGDSQYPPFTLEGYQQLLFENVANYRVEAEHMALQPEHQGLSYTLNPGKATGELIGGNLTLISTLMGTEFQPDFRDKIVFLEDIGEAPYRIDRMLTQLLLSGEIQHAAGIALGIFHDCEVDPEDPDFPDTLSLAEVLRDRLGPLDIPIVYGLPFGHIADNAVIPYGISAILDADTRTLRLTERALS